MSSARSPSPARGDAWLSAILFAGFAATTAVAATYSPLARAVPMLVGVLGASLTAVQFIRTARHLRTAPAKAPTPWSPDHLVMFGWLIAAATLVAVLGILAGGALFIAAFLQVRLRESWPSAILAGLLLSAVLHLMLERGLGVYLFGGLIWR
jgi:Tripartite tricarboxylate transporter TctB family